jgi:hypothetical protein
MSTTTSDFRTDDAGSRRFRGVGVEAREYESTPSLLRRLIADVSALFAQEVALFKAETTEAIGDLKAATTSIALGGAVTFLGLLFLLLSAVYGLSNVVEPWLAALIVGAAVTLIGIVLLATGRSKLAPSNMAPRRTAASLRRDTELIKGVGHEQR